MDGPISYTNATTTNTISLQDNLLTGIEIASDPGTYSGTWIITGYTPYWTTEYSSRILEEECDTGGEKSIHDDGVEYYHGCDRLCRVMSGWECFHYYHHIVGVELPYFTSICDETEASGYRTFGYTSRRRLSPDDFDSRGRILHF